MLTYRSIMHSPEGWFKVADSLWFSAMELQRAAEVAMREYHALLEVKTEMWANGSWDPDRKRTWTADQKALLKRIEELAPASESWRVATMLRAMSIECELKGGYYTLELAAKGHVDKVTSLESGHNLAMFARAAGMTLDAADEGLLKSLSILIQLGRYPIAREGKKKNRTYHINFGTQPDAEIKLRTRLKKHCRKLWREYSAKSRRASKNAAA